MKTSLVNTIIVLAACCLAHVHHLRADTTIQVSIDLSLDTVQAPSSYLGLSHEPITTARQVLPTLQYRNFIKLLSSFQTGPFIIRWGGNAQDNQLDIIEDEHWISMRDLHQETGVQYMIGLNLAARDPGLAVTQVGNAMRFLPPGAILAFNIGNEADAFMYKRNKTVFQADYWKNGWFTDITAYCNALQPLFMQYFNHTKLVTGPGGADMTMWKGEQAQKFAGLQPLAPFAAMLTAHFYTARATAPGANTSTFLAEPVMALVSRRVQYWVRWANLYKIQFRLEETNTLALSGLAGASNTLGAALYYIDYALSMMQIGVSGLNFHDSYCSPYSPIMFPSVCLPNVSLGACPDLCSHPEAMPYVSAPYYGLLFLQMALQSLPQLYVASAVHRTPNVPNIKTYVLRSRDELRIVLVKKDGVTPAIINLTLNVAWGRPGVLKVLQGPTITALAQDMNLAGQQVSADGFLSGVEELQHVTVTSDDSSSTYSITMPPFSAGLLIIPSDGETDGSLAVC
ncbi:hypothetical protein CEUSTIGMA_g1622.t1 [Chlamydomonas eustigma]|uniref:Beta-glucuronidase C-terminal domain-containing protein n=1 Tax=Chlamydomonas eustigma TaxID=1157962 RepID=A0A250WTM8_9CHLO|nr:hypothetical protein CEUSTIGMA_g1622.t1 [Chlamydomonas eustigma]|eukprot:GAX74173.1 hypothetical protein CEUSTIGMA_g1622.t1 [Chlamydomonas eustigma]